MSACILLLKNGQVNTFFFLHPGRIKSSVPEVMLYSAQEQEDNQKPQTKPAIKVPACRSPFVSIQHCRNTGLTSSQNLITVGATQTPLKYAQNVANLAFPISKPQSERVLGWDTLPKQCQAAHPNHSSNSNISLQQKCAAFSNNEKILPSLQIRPVLHLSTLEDLYHAQ